jgi:hypothetical protein
MCAETRRYLLGTEREKGQKREIQTGLSKKLTKQVYLSDEEKSSEVKKASRACELLLGGPPRKK